MFKGKNKSVKKLGLVGYHKTKKIGAERHVNIMRRSKGTFGKSGHLTQKVKGSRRGRRR